MRETHTHSHEETWIVKTAQALHLPGFSHEHDLRQDSVILDHELGIRTVKLALLALGLTTLLQILIFMASGSVALLADTVHNFGDSLNSVPLLLAFMLARRSPNRRYTYGYGRAEDLAGILIVISIAFSAGYILYESIYKLLHPQSLDYLEWVAAAAVIGFLGNELVALMQIRVGQRIGSEAMVADGLHARVDGFTSLAVLVAVIGTWLGYPIIDPVIGIVIGAAIVGITWSAAKSMWYRLMDAVDPELVHRVEHVVEHHTAIKTADRIQLRWVGHRLHGELVFSVDGRLTVQESDELVHHLQHHLKDELPNLGEVTVCLKPAN